MLDKKIKKYERKKDRKKEGKKETVTLVKSAWLSMPPLSIIVEKEAISLQCLLKMSILYYYP